MARMVAKLEELGAATQCIEAEPSQLVGRRSTQRVPIQPISSRLLNIARIAAGIAIIATVWFAWQRAATLRDTSHQDLSAVRHFAAQQRTNESDCGIRLQGHSRRELFAVAGATMDNNVRAFVLYRRE